MSTKGPPMKKAKLDQGPKLDSLSLVKCKALHKNTPGCQHGCRIAAQAVGDVSCNLYIASGPSIFMSRVEHVPGSSWSQGMGGVSLPSASQEAAFASTACPALPAEIQSLSLSAAPSGALCLAAVDAYGSGMVQRLDAEGGCLGQAVRLTDDDDIGEAGWAGVAVNYTGKSFTAVTACQYARSVAWYVDGTLQRTMGTLHQPNAVVSVGGHGSESFAVAEGPHVTLWDPRMQERRGCYSRLASGGAELPLYALASDPTGNLLATGGAEGTVFFFDIRKEGQPLDRWTSGLKYDVISLQFPAARSDYIFAGGADQDIRCDLVDSRARKAAAKNQPDVITSQSRTRKGGGLAIRGDARWMGLARAPNSDLLVGLTALQTAVLARVSFD